MVAGVLTAQNGNFMYGTVIPHGPGSTLYSLRPIMIVLLCVSCSHKLRALTSVEGAFVTPIE